MGTHIDRARPTGRPCFVYWNRNDLPREGLTDWMATAVAREDGQVIGSAALGICPDGATARSVAIAPEAAAVWVTTVAAAIQLADTLNAQPADDDRGPFFPRFGFERIARADVRPRSGVD
jgi:N-acetylglutamate synthase-like GNAT family acetyltransferase